MSKQDINLIDWACIEASNMRNNFYTHHLTHKSLEEVNAMWRKAKERWLRDRMKSLELQDGTYYKPGFEYINLVYSMM